MELLGLLVPFAAAGGWLWWIYRADQFEREPWPLVLKTFGLGAAAGFVGLLALILFVLLVPEESDLILLTFIALVPLHVAGITAVLRWLPFRSLDWNEPFDGLVYGGAAGIGYGLTYTLFALIDSPLLGFRSAIFTIPIYMLAGLLIGHYMSQVRFGVPERRRSMWVRGFVVAGLYLAGLELARTLGGEVLGSEHPVASAVVYGANTVGWIMALWAMDAKDRASRFNPANYRIWLADTGCPHCGYAHPMGANYCNWCGQPLAAQHGQQGVQS